MAKKKKKKTYDKDWEPVEGMKVRRIQGGEKGILKRAWCLEFPDESWCYFYDDDEVHLELMPLLKEEPPEPDSFDECSNVDEIIKQLQKEHKMVAMSCGTADTKLFVLHMLRCMEKLATCIKDINKCEK